MGLVHPELPDFYNRGGITYQIQELKYKDGKIYNKFTQIEMLWRRHLTRNYELNVRMFFSYLIANNVINNS